MSILGIDWNGDGKVNCEDTIVDLFVLNELGKDDSNDSKNTEDDD